MKRAKLLLLTLLAVVGWNTAQAETVSPYTVDFNTAISTEGDFAVAPNWGHVVNSNVSYTYVADGGVDGSGALRTYTNQKSKNYYDLLVTPLVSGTVTLYVKPVSRWYNDSAILEFYSMDENGETRGELLASTSFSDKPNSEEWDWYALTINLETAQRIGIRASEVYFDDFSAASAEIVPQTTLKVTGVMNSNGQTGTSGTNPSFSQGPDGNTVVTLKAKLQNTGNVDLVAGVTENYTLTLAQGTESSVTTYFEDAPFAITEDLAAGESKVIDVEFTVPATIPSNGYTYFYIRENVSGSTSNSWRYCQLKEYASKFVFDVAGTNYYSNPSPTNKPIAFGKVTASTTLNYEIYNAGAAPLVINSITLPEGYTSDAPTGEFTVAGGEKKQIAITLPATTPGIFSGNLTIEYTNYGKSMATYTLAVTGTVLDSSKNFITFDDGAGNAYYPQGSVRYNTYISSEGSGSTKNYYLQGSGSNPLYITPLMTATDNESITFDAEYTNYSSAKVEVMISTDRQNWTTIQTISSIASSYNWTTYTATIPSAGNYYIGFKVTNAKIDNIYGLTLATAPEHDLLLVKSNIPATGKQNNDYTATASIGNVGPNVETAGSYTATLYVDGEAVATSNEVDLPVAVISGNYNNGEEENYTTLSFTFRPHIIGEKPVYIEVKSGDAVVTTEVVNVNFAEEKVESDVAISGENTSNGSLLHLNWNNSESITLYTPAMLENAGLKSGDEIESITFKGYCSNSTDYSTQLSVWYESTTDASQTQPDAGKYNTTNMTQVLSETHTWTAVGSSNDWVDLITINLAEPIVYDGNALRFVVRSEGTTYKSGTYFEVTNTSGNGKSYYNRNDNANTFANSQTWSQNSYVPAIHFGLKAEAKTLSGLVTERYGVTPVAGATVTIRNAENDIEYFATTDEEGAYTINVVQDKLTYTATVTADGYETLAEDYVLDFSEGSQTRDFALTHTPINFSGTVVDQEGNPIPNVAVTINIEGVMYTRITNMNGIFSFKVKITNFTYRVTITAEGYETFEEEGEFNLSMTPPTFILTKIQEPVVVTISEYGYATFYYENSAYVIPEGVEVKYVEGVNGKTLSFLNVNDVIPAGFAVILEGEPGEYTFEPTSEEGSVVGENKLRGTEETMLIVPEEEECKYYKLAVKNGKVGFYYGTNDGEIFENEAHKAYLPVPVGQAHGVNCFLFDDATGIDNIETVEKADRTYNLSGQRVNDSYKGVTIVNGKKVMRK